MFETQQGAQAPPQQQYTPPPATVPNGPNPLFAGGGVAGQGLPQAAPVPAAFVPTPTPQGQQVPVPGQIQIPPQAPPQAPAPSRIEQEAAQLRQQLQLQQQQIAQMMPLVLQQRQQQQQQAPQQQPGAIPQSSAPQQSQVPQFGVYNPFNAQPQQPASPYDVTPFDSADLQYLQSDDQGNITAKPGAPPFLVERYMQHKSQMRMLGERLPSILKQLDTELKNVKQENEKYRQEKAMEQQRAETDRMVAEVSPWAFVRDGSGNEVIDFDPMTGQQVARLTPLGQVYSQSLQEAAQLGISAPKARHQYAQKAVEAVKARIPQNQPNPQLASLQQQFGQPAPQFGQAPHQQTYQQPAPAPMFGYQHPNQLQQPGLNSLPHQTGNGTVGRGGRRMSLLDMARVEAAKLGVAI